MRCSTFFPDHDHGFFVSSKIVQILRVFGLLFGKRLISFSAREVAV